LISLGQSLTAARCLLRPLRRMTMPASAAGADLPGGELPSTSTHHLELMALRADFPHFRIWRETTMGRARYVSLRQRPDLHPHTVITKDPGELRAILQDSRTPAQ
jgi:hypothetical protein